MALFLRTTARSNSLAVSYCEVQGFSRLFRIRTCSAFRPHRCSSETSEPTQKPHKHVKHQFSQDRDASNGGGTTSNVLVTCTQGVETKNGVVSKLLFQTFGAGFGSITNKKKDILRCSTIFVFNQHHLDTPRTCSRMGDNVHGSSCGEIDMWRACFRQLLGAGGRSEPPDSKQWPCPLDGGHLGRVAASCGRPGKVHQHLGAAGTWVRRGIPLRVEVRIALHVFPP